MRVAVRFAFLLLAVCLAACSAAPDPAPKAVACTVERVASISAHVGDGAILIPARINLHPVQLQVDTGSMTTLIDTDAVAQLGLPADPYRHTTVRGIGGQELTQNALVQSLDIGGQEWQMLSLTTGHRAMPKNATEAVAGLLGGDRMSAFDVELDLPHNRMTLWQVSGCSGNFALKGMPHYIVPLSMHPPNRLVAHVYLNGHPIEALIDWGARATTISDAAAASAEVPEAAMAGDRTGKSWGIDGNEKVTRMHRFDTLRVGGETFHSVRLNVGDVNLYEVGMLLGPDFVRKRHIWLSYATRQMFVVPPRYAVAAAPGS